MLSVAVITSGIPILTIQKLKSEVLGNHHNQSDCHHVIINQMSPCMFSETFTLPDDSNNNTWQNLDRSIHILQWKGISCKQNARWQHLSRLKASAFFSLKKKIVVKKHYNLYLGLVTPSSGWRSPIVLKNVHINICREKGLVLSFVYKFGWVARRHC